MNYFLMSWGPIILVGFVLFCINVLFARIIIEIISAGLKLLSRKEKKKVWVIVLALVFLGLEILGFHQLQKNLARDRSFNEGAFLEHVKYDEYRQAERMLKINPDLVNKKGLRGRKAIEVAKSERMIRLLVKYGANPNDRCLGDNWLNTTWDDRKSQYMWMGPNWNIIKGLIAVGGDINCQRNHGPTALHGAARLQDPKFIKYLIENGANVHSTDIAGKTPLHYIAFGFQHDFIKAEIHLKKNPIESVKILIEHGADINALDKSRRTLLDYVDYDPKLQEFTNFLRVSGAKKGN